jgi:N-acyl-D-aspartate/D-glutamate deacylase
MPHSVEAFDRYLSVNSAIMHDLVVRGGLVVDGTGAPARTADVAVSDGLIVEVGQVRGRARRQIDADGSLVTPGFVDIHTHYDGQATWDPHLTPSCWHGVTTAVLGNCGVGFAPVRSDGHEALIELMEGVEDIPGTALSEGMTWGWETFDEYLDALDSQPHAVDLGTQVPHAALRSYVMGKRARDDAGADDIAAMVAALTEGLRAGALGFSTGRTAGHRTVHGEPVPGTYAAKDELAALVGAVQSNGHGVVEVVPSGVGGLIAGDADDAMDTELDWMLELGLRSRVPLTFLAMQQDREIDRWKPWFDRVRAANHRGARIHPQVACRCFGVLMGHQSRLNPFRHRVTYQAIAELPLAERVKLLRRPEVRRSILDDKPDHTGPFAMDQIGRRAFDRLFPLGSELDYEPVTEASIGSVARREGRDPWEVGYDAMLESEGRDFLLLPLLNYGGDSYDGLADMMNDPMTVQGLGDGGAHVGLVCDASMTTYLASYWTRDRTRGRRIPLETAVRRLTRDPAHLYGLLDRGLVEPGRKADLNIIDYDHLRLLHPEEVTDLPGGAGRLIQRSEGYVSTLVGGEEIAASGELTDARPGRVLRGPQLTRTHRRSNSRARVL